MGFLWTKKEENLLIYYWGEKPKEWISEKIGRTLKACEKRILELTGSRSIKRGKWTQASLAAETGFNDQQIRWAVKELGLRVQQKPKERKDEKAKSRRPWDNSAWLIDDNHRDKIIDWLCRYRWMKNNKFPCCTECTTMDIPHKANGVCHRCYSRKRAQRKRAA